MAANNPQFLFFFLIFLFFSVALPINGEEHCVYNFYVKTGSIIKGGTDSVISLRLYDANGYYLQINNIETWGGLMGPHHDYFERGNIDVFSGRAPCLTASICGVNVTSDGSGSHHGWYCNYVKVSVSSVHAATCSVKEFYVEQWLAMDAPPYEVTAVRSFCPYDINAGGVVGADDDGSGQPTVQSSHDSAASAAM